MNKQQNLAEAAARIKLSINRCIEMETFLYKCCKNLNVLLTEMNFSL